MKSSIASSSAERWFLVNFCNAVVEFKLPPLIAINMLPMNKFAETFRCPKMKNRIRSIALENTYVLCSSWFWTFLTSFLNIFKSIIGHKRVCFRFAVQFWATQYWYLQQIVRMTEYVIISSMLSVFTKDRFSNSRNLWEL